MMSKVNCTPQPPKRSYNIAVDVLRGALHDCPLLPTRGAIGISCHLSSEQETRVKPKLQSCPPAVLRGIVSSTGVLQAYSEQLSLLGSPDILCGKVCCSLVIFNDLGGYIGSVLQGSVAESAGREMSGKEFELNMSTSDDLGGSSDEGVSRRLRSVVVVVRNASPASQLRRWRIPRLSQMKARRERIGARYHNTRRASGQRADRRSPPRRREGGREGDARSRKEEGNSSHGNG